MIRILLLCHSILNGLYDSHYPLLCFSILLFGEFSNSKRFHYFLKSNEKYYESSHFVPTRSTIEDFQDSYEKLSLISSTKTLSYKSYAGLPRQRSAIVQLIGSLFINLILAFSFLFHEKLLLFILLIKGARFALNRRTVSLLPKISRTFERLVFDCFSSECKKTSSQTVWLPIEKKARLPNL